MENKIKINDFVWAKMKGCPPWPSAVLEPGPNVPEKPSSQMHWIYFFGSHNYSWIEYKHLKPFESYKDQCTSSPKMSVPLKEAVKEAERILQELQQNPNYTWPIKPFEPKGKVTSKRVKEPSAGTSKRPKRTTLRVNNAEFSANSSYLDLSYDVISTKHIRTSNLTFGILGIGIIGSRIVKKMIKSGHKVNIWNRTSQRCTEIKTQIQKNFTGIGELNTFLTPREVMSNSDIVLNCVSDCDVSKKIIQNHFGINLSSDNILTGKGFVEMTSIDPETSKDIRDMIEMKGGRYLEAQIQGSVTEAEEGKLVLLTAGNKSLFSECQSCFEAIGTSAFYLGDVGYATKINLIFQLIKGICLVGLTEGFALAERCKIPFHIFLPAFKATNLASNYLNGKVEIIVSKNFNNVEQSLLNMQKDMYLGLEMSNKIGQPMELASIANEIFKHCRRFDLSDKDASSIYLRSRF